MISDRKITLITPTADQPAGIKLMERWMLNQSIKFDQWIVADDGNEPATLRMGQEHIVSPRIHEGGQSLASNLIKALARAEGDFIFIIEHDDFYNHNHLQTQALRLLDGAHAAGSVTQRYYNISRRCYRVMDNVGTSLCNLAFHKSLIPLMASVAADCFTRGTYGIDREFYEQSMREGHRWGLHNIDTVVGMKGLPGRAGLGIGHRPEQSPAKWTADDECKVLREWVGLTSSYQYFTMPWKPLHGKR